MSTSIEFWGLLERSGSYVKCCYFNVFESNLINCGETQLFYFLSFS